MKEAESSPLPSSPKSIEDRVREVNVRLQKGEPTNITVDAFTGFTGYKCQYIKDAMNAVFGIGQWGSEELSSEVVSSRTEKGNDVHLVVSRVEVWLAGVDFHPRAWGQSRVTRGDVGDAKKGAETDAMKKALSFFSIGNRAYHGLLKGEKT